MGFYIIVSESGNMTSEHKTYSSESEALDTLSERKMFLQLPEERPLIRRSTSPTIKITSDTSTKYVFQNIQWRPTRLSPG